MAPRKLRSPAIRTWQKPKCANFRGKSLRNVRIVSRGAQSAIRGPFGPRGADLSTAEGYPHVFRAHPQTAGNPHILALIQVWVSGPPHPSGNFAESYGESARFGAIDRDKLIRSGSPPSDLRWVKIHCIAILPYHGAIWAGRLRRANRRNCHFPTRSAF